MYCSAIKLNLMIIKINILILQEINQDWQETRSELLVVCLILDIDCVKTVKRQKHLTCN